MTEHVPLVVSPSQDQNLENEDEGAESEREDDRQFKGDACMIYMPASPNPYMLKKQVA